MSEERFVDVADQYIADHYVTFSVRFGFHSHWLMLSDEKQGPDKHKRLAPHIAVR